MKTFTIEANDFLKQPVEGWYHSDYVGGCNRHNIPDTIENIICTLKNDIDVKAPDDLILRRAVNNLHGVLTEDLANIKRTIDSPITVCVIPRAKVNYEPHQLLFKETIKKVVNELNMLDGSDYITRRLNTRTTHRNRAGFGGDGPMPYVGITRDTCTISDDVEGKTIILIDDVYTSSVNIDEDAIQALLDKGASRVVFYAVGHTV